MTNEDQNDLAGTDPGAGADGPEGGLADTPPAGATAGTAAVHGGQDAGLATPEFGELGATRRGADPAALSVLFDLSLPVAIELGRTRMAVQDVLTLGRGSVIQLDRLAGEPVDVFVGDRRFAEGEVVVIGEQFGIRITRILAPAVPGELAEAS